MTSPAAARLLVAALLAGALAGALAGVGGCARQEEPAAPPAATCLVQGRVGGAVGGETVRVEFSGAGPGPGERLFTVTTDSAGRYRVELPAGDYLAAATGAGSRHFHTANGLDPREDRADTLRLRAGAPPLTVDFPLGSLRLVADVPASLVGSRLLFLVRSRWPQDSAPSSFRSANVRVADRHLEVTFPVLPPGDYSVEAGWEWDGTHHGDTFWLPEATTLAQAARYRVGADSLCTATMALTAEPARVSGSVTGAWRELGLSAPMVLVESPEGERLAGYWQVDDDGRFAIDLYLPRPFRLEVHIGGTVMWLGGSGPEDATVFTPGPGQSIDGLDIVRSGLRLQVAVDETLSDFDAADFELCDPVSFAPVHTWSSSLSPRMGVAGLPPGTWLLRVSHRYFYNAAAWRSQWFDRAADPASATPVVIPSGGGIALLDLVLQPGGFIGGTAVSAAGDSSFVQILLTSADDSAALDRWYAHLPSGEFRFQGLSDGTYRVGAAPPGAEWIGEGMTPPAGTIWYPGTTDWAASAAFAIAGGDTVRDLFITVP